MTLSPSNFHTLLTFSMSAITLTAHADTFKWTKNGGNDNWTNSSNWNQSGGSGDYPSQKRSSDDVELLGNFSNNASKFDTDLTSGDKPGDATIEIANLDVETDSSSDNWIIRAGGQSGAKLKVSGSMAFYHNGNLGTFTSYVPIELSSNNVNIAAQGGSRTHFNGPIIGGNSVVLNADTSLSTPNYSGLFGGTLNFNVANPNFTGTIEYGRTRIHAGHTLAFEDCAVKMPSDVTHYNSNRFTFVNNARVGSLATGHTAHKVTLSNNLYVGYNNASVTHTGYFDGSGDLYKVGTGVWTLNGSTSHTGNTFINAGQIKLTNQNALKNSHLQTDIDNGLDPNGNHVYLAALSGNGNLNIGSKNLTIGGGADGSHGGSISGSGAVTIDNSSNTQRLSPSNTYSGGTFLSSGTLEVYHTNCLGNTIGKLTIGNGTLHTLISHTQNREMGFAYASSNAQFEVDATVTLTWSGPVNDDASSQTITKKGAGVMSFTNNANTFPGTLNIEAGSVSLSSTAMQHATVETNLDHSLTFTDSVTTLGALNGSGDISLGSSQTLILGANDSKFTYSGALSGLASSSFTKIGSGEFILSGTSNFSSKSHLNEGLLILDGNLSSPMIGSLDSQHDSSLEGNGRSSGRLYLSGDISPDTPGVGNAGTIQAGSIFLFKNYYCDLLGSESDRLITAGVFDPSNATLQLGLPEGAINGSAYIIASYGSLIGHFQSVNNLPAGYKLDYQYNDGSSSNNIAIVKDDTAPTLNTISLQDGISSPTKANSVKFDISFSEEVTGVGANDFLITKSGVATGNATLTGSGSDYLLSIPNITGDGTINVTLKPSGHEITDNATNPLSASAASDSVSIDNTAPVITLSGGTHVTRVVGETWTELASVSDNMDTSVNLIIGGDTVNTSMAGVYTITYNATDAAGNAAPPSTRTLTVITDFQQWATNIGLTGDDALLSADPDQDGRNNLQEFAFNDDPQSPTTSDSVKEAISTLSGKEYLTLTFPVRAGATFSGSTSMSASIDGLTYTISASTDLSAFSATVAEITPALTIGRPALPQGWEYHSFRLHSDLGQLGKGFMKVEINSLP